MAQITWKNVAGPDGAGAAKAVAQAGQTVASGLDRIANFGLQQQQQSIQNDARVKKENTDRALSVINSIGSVEDQEKAVKSGMFSADNIQNQFGDVDINTITSALNAKGGSIRKEAIAKSQFSDFEREKSERVEVAKINAMIAKGDPEAQSAIDGSGVLDKASLINSLNNTNSRTEAERRKNEVYIRDQDTISDTDKLNTVYNTLTSDRVANIEASKQINADFVNLMRQSGVPDNTFEVDDSGNLRFSNSATPQMQEVIRSEYSLAKSNLPSIRTDKQQIEQLQSVATTLNADPKTTSSLITALKKNQADRLTLTPEGQEHVAAVTSNADRQFDQIVEAEQTTLEQAKRDNPVNFNVTAQQEKIKPSDGIISATEYVRDSVYGGDPDDSDVNKFSRLLNDRIESGYKDSRGNTTSYPGWVIEEGAKRAQASIGSNVVGYFGIDTNVSKVVTEIDKVMQQHLSDQDNQKVLDALSTDSKARVFAAEAARQNQIKNGITDAKSISGIYNIQNNSVRALQNAVRNTANPLNQ